MNLVLVIPMHGAPPLHLPVEVMTIEQATRTMAGRGTVRLTDGTEYHVTNIEDVVAALTLDMEQES